MAFDTAEVVMQKLIALATTKGDGAFTIRIIARRAGSVVPTALAMFHQGTINHIGNIEAWLPLLVGGGEYTIAVNHASDVGVRYTFTMNLPGNPFPQTQINAINGPSWQGPTDIANVPVPTEPVPPAQQYNTAFQQPGGWPALPQQRQTISSQPAMAQTFQQMAATPAEQLLVVQREESKARESLDRRQAELDKRDTEDRMRREAQDRETKLKSEMTAQFDSFKALLASQQKPAEPKTDPMAAIAALLAGLAPIANAFISGNNDMKRLQIEMGQRQAEMAATTARDIAAAQAKAAEAQTTMLLKLTERPAQSPEMAAMLDLTRAQAESQGAMMGQIVNAMGTVSKMSIGMIETIADLTAPPEGSPVADAIKDTVKALGSLMNGADKGARNAITSQQQAIPQKQQKPGLPPGAPTQQQIEEARKRAATVNQQAQAQQQAHVAATAAAATQPANVVQFPTSPVPSAPSVPEAPTAQEMPDGFAGIETKTTVDELEDLIRKHHEPVEAVAQFLLDNLKDPAMTGALRKAEGDPNVLIAERFGLIWLSDEGNQGYIERLAEALEELAEAQGLSAPEDDAAVPASDSAAPVAS